MQPIRRKSPKPSKMWLRDDLPDEIEMETEEVSSGVDVLASDMLASDGAKKRRVSGPDVIRDQVSRLPGRPGVYRMFGEAGELLYVGKARNLKARVGSYAKIGGQTQRIARMISLTRAMEFVVTASETEALLLEANLIKKLKPRFNIILRDDKSFPHILIREDHEAPQALKHRGTKRIKGKYFGPFASAGAVDHTLDTLQKAFLLRTCTDNIYSTRSRPCMLHQMGTMFGAVRGADPAGRVSRPGARGGALPQWRCGDAAGAAVGADGARGGEHGLRAGGSLARPHPRAVIRAPEPERQPGRAGGGGCVRHPLGSGRIGRAGLLLPRGPELGRDRLVSQA
jgi:hypothetical protein